MLDETHTQVCGPGGLTGQWDLHPDLVVLGKSFAGGVPLGAYGMSDELADRFRRPDPDRPHAAIASGGTLFANAVAMAAARVMLGELLTDEAYTRTATLGARLADWIDRIATESGLPWKAHRLFARSGYAFCGVPARNHAEYVQSHPRDITNLRRVYFANRGIWDAIYSAGPCVSTAHRGAEIDSYPDLLSDLMHEVVV